MNPRNPLRRMPMGAEVQPDGGVHFRVWAPERKRIELIFEPGPITDLPDKVSLTREPGGYFSAFVPQAGCGTRYRFRVEDRAGQYPDPASRFQPEGPHGPSEVVDPADFTWNDAKWRGVGLLGQVIYELHIGTFTPEGTYAAAAEQFEELARLGVTVVELMPVADFPGKFGWGYDGVNLFAPTRLYGTPDDLRALVDRAHQLGLGVLLDVVYNHIGPSGNYLRCFSDHYFTDRHRNEWGEGLNYDDRDSANVREFFIANAGYWIDEFHFDGLRLDAIQAIVDDSPEHILSAITRRVREAAGGRETLIVAESERQQSWQMAPPDKGGYGIDASWNDDFHHSARVAATGQNEYYYAEYTGSAQELISATRWGYLFQGQWHAGQRRVRGAPAFHLSAARFVTFLENHDQVSNSGQALRLHQLTSPGRHRALTALLLLAPGTPLLFQGQEFASSKPFYYFADHEIDLAKLVHEGRVSFLKHFNSLAGLQPGDFVDPADPQTFAASKLDFSERQRHATTYNMFRDLLRLRREDAVFSAQRADRLHGAVLTTESFVLRFFGDDGDDRLLIVNLGLGQHGYSAAEPLLAPSAGREWRVLWSSQEPRYGGPGTPPLDTQEDWHLPGHAAIVLAARDRPASSAEKH